MDLNMVKYVKLNVVHSCWQVQISQCILHPFEKIRFLADPFLNSFSLIYCIH